MPSSMVTLSAARRDLARHRRFQAALWRLYAFDGYHASLARRETLICRCEEVSFGEIEDALAEDLTMIGAVKRRTRIGMGRCQGRYCGPVLDTLMGARLGYARDDYTGFAPRVRLLSTHEGALRYTDLKTLRAYALDLS